MALKLRIDIDTIDAIVGLFIIIAWTLSGYFYRRLWGPMLFSEDGKAPHRLMYYVLGVGTIWGPFKLYAVGFPIDDVIPAVNLILLILVIPLSGMSVIGALMLGGWFYKDKTDSSSNEPKQTAESGGFVNIYSPTTEPELAVVQSMLEAHDIPCFIHNRNFGSIYPGLQIDSYNNRTVMVAKELEADARELLHQFQKDSVDSQSAMTMTSFDKMRIIFEGLLFGWFVPGKRTKNNDNS